MSGLEFIKRRRREKAIEDVLFAYPYLISPELRFPRRQEVLSKTSRTDLAFYFPTRVVIVEIKRGVAGVPALRQLERYLREHKLKGMVAEGILLAHGFNEACLRASKTSRWSTCCKCLQREVPTDIVICADCREARDRRMEACPHDGSTDVLKLLG